MLIGSLLISGRDLLPLVVGFGLAALIAVLWAYRRSPATPAVQGACFSLKLLGFAVLFLCLLEPLWSGQRARPGANSFAILADNSQSMQIRDHSQSRTRGELLREAVTVEKSNWQGRLEENFQLRRYLFDSRLQYTKDFGELDFQGRATSLGSSLRSLADRYQGQPLAGALLFTDGNATDLAGNLGQLKGLPPIFPVLVGQDDPITDIAIQKVAVGQTAFEDAPVWVQADVAATGYGGQPVICQLLEHRNSSSSFTETNSVATQTVVAEQMQRAPKDGELMSFRFQVRPLTSGVTFYRVRVSAKGETEQAEVASASIETTLANNTRLVTVDRGKGPYRVLYVAGRPNWEYKFLNRAIEDDDQVDLVALIRIARREPKLEFRGRAGESSNPLFRGFGNQSQEEIERYDQPVLRRLNTRDALELQGGFPRTAEELYEYHAVIVDDLEAEFFTHDQMALLQKYVSERGGGFLMLGGQESFREGSFARTPIGDMLPVYLDRATEASGPNQFRMDLTREGWLQPWARLRNNEAEEKIRLDEMPPFQVLNRVGESKPGASTIATVTDIQGRQLPALVVQRFGHGRTASLLIGDMWHWGFRDKEARQDMDKAWRQLVRWLIADVPNQVDLQVVQKPLDPDQAILLQARVKDRKFEPMDNATVSFEVRSVVDSSPGGPSANPLMPIQIRIPAEPALAEPGLYEATFLPRHSGGYLVETVVTDSRGAEVGRTATGWSSDPAAEEFRSLKPNRALLDSLARETGGEIIDASRLEAFATSLPHRKVPVTETWSYPIWHQPFVFLFALACFAAEWGLRRWKGLA
jgi:uncharacterized membrane protein